MLLILILLAPTPIHILAILTVVVEHSYLVVDLPRLPDELVGELRKVRTYWLSIHTQVVATHVVASHVVALFAHLWHCILLNVVAVIILDSRPMHHLNIIGVRHVLLLLCLLHQVCQFSTTILLQLQDW